MTGHRKLPFIEFEDGTKAAIGIVVACVGILGAAMMEGTSPTAFLNMPAMILVFVGTFGVAMACGLPSG